jgi:hypothetical protein
MNIRRLGISVVVAAVVIATTEFSQIIPRQTASSNPADESISWLAAGDSYASGTGLPNTTKHCARGTGTYGESSTWAVIAANRLNNEITQTHKSMDSPSLVACTGAISDQFFNADGSANYPEWSPDHAVRQKISLLNSTGVYKGSELIPPYPTFLRRVATSAVTKGGNIVVMGYPEIFEDPSLVSSVLRCEEFSPGAMATARGWAGDLNATIGNAVAQVNALPGAQRNWVHITYINPVTGQSSNGIALSDQYLFEPSKGVRHELCSSGNQPWLNGLSVHLTTRSYHPNQAGEDAMGNLAAEVISKLSFPSRFPVNQTATCTPSLLADSADSHQMAVGNRQPLLLTRIYCSGGWAVGYYALASQPVLTAQFIWKAVAGQWKVVYSGTDPPVLSEIGISSSVLNGLLVHIQSVGLQLSPPIRIY